MMFVSIPDKMVCYRGVRIQCNHNSIRILCAIEAVGYHMHEDCHKTSHTTDGGQNRRVAALCDHVVSLHRARVFGRINNRPL